MNLTERTFTKIKYIIRKSPKRKLSRRNDGRSMLCQSKEVFCICVLFQESRGSVNEKPKANVYTCFYHIGRDFKAV